MQKKTSLNARLSQLSKLEDSKSFSQNKKTAIVGQTNGQTAGSGTDKGSSGFKFFHLMLIALISLIIGAFISRSANESTTTATDL